MLLYRYLRIIETRTRNPGVIVHSVPRNPGIWGHRKIIWIRSLNLKELRSVKEYSTPQRMTSVVGHPKNRLYINSGAFLHILFNKELMEGLVNLNKPLKIQAGGKLVHMSQIGSLHQVWRHLPLPVNTYNYSETAIANLLLFAKLANEYSVICNTRIGGAIYVQSKDDGKYL